MTAYLRERDVNRHLTTNSYAIRDQSPIWQMPELDIVQKHEYADQVRSSNLDLADRAAQDYQTLAASVPPKPILLGEFGYSAANYGDDVEKTGIHLHNGLWATTFSGYAGSGMYWWWDVYIEANNLWYHFNGLAEFLAGEDLTLYEPFSPLQITGTDGAAGQAVGLGLRGEENTLIWFRSRDYTTQASVEAQRSGTATPSSYLPPLLEDQVLTLHEMAEGDYTVHWFDPQIAEWFPEATVTSQNNTLTIAIPPFNRDLAARIVRKKGEAPSTQAAPEDTLTIAAGQPIRIALVGPSSGTHAAYLPALVTAAQMAAQAYGPVQGFSVEFVPFDDGCSEEGGARAAQEIIGDGTFAAVLGPLCSRAAASGLPDYERAGIVLISPGVTDPEIRAYGPTVFNRVLLHDDQLANAGLEADYIEALESVQSFYADFQTYTGSPPPEAYRPYLAYGYDAAMILLQTIHMIAQVDPNGALTINRTALIRAVRATAEYPGVTGSINFDAYGNREEP